MTDAVPGWEPTQQDLVSCVLNLNGTRRPFHYRGNSAGDRGVLMQVFESNDYELDHFTATQALYAYAHQQGTRGARHLILDLGANIGASPLWFSAKYPTSHVVAVEPERNNFELLRSNCAGMDIVAHHAAIGAVSGAGYVVDPGIGDWGFRIADKGNERVDVITPAQILHHYPRSEFFPFICKIDIEGGESELFSRDCQWMNEFPLLIIELHDWMLPGEGSSRNFLRAVLQFDFDFLYRGENVFCFNNRLLRRPVTSEPQPSLE